MSRVHKGRAYQGYASYNDSDELYQGIPGKKIGKKSKKSKKKVKGISNAWKPQSKRKSYSSMYTCMLTAVFNSINVFE